MPGCSSAAAVPPPTSSACPRCCARRPGPGIEEHQPQHREHDAVGTTVWAWRLKADEFMSSPRQRLILSAMKTYTNFKYCTGIIAQYPIAFCHGSIDLPVAEATHRQIAVGPHRTPATSASDRLDEAVAGGAQGTLAVRAEVGELAPAGPRSPPPGWPPGSLPAAPAEGCSCCRLSGRRPSLPPSVPHRTARHAARTARPARRGAAGCRHCTGRPGPRSAPGGSPPARPAPPAGAAGCR